MTDEAAADRIPEKLPPAQRGGFPDVVTSSSAPDLETPLPVAPPGFDDSSADPISTNERPRVTLAKDLKEYISDLKRRLRRKGQELREARKYLDNIVRSMVDALIVIDTDGIVRTVNPATQELLGWKRKELVGKPAAMLFANPADADAFSGSHSDELMSAGMIRLEEVACRHRDGVTIPVSFTASAMRDEDGRLIGFVGIARDIRELKRLEQEKIHAIRALAASVAHEIRNPLGAIQNSTGLLKRDLDNVSEEDGQLLDIVAEESERIATIVTDFLNFARPSGARFTDVDLITLVNETALLAQQDSRCRLGLDVVTDVPPELPLVRADPDKLRQVIWNLLINALEAIPRGDGEVTVRVVGRGGTDPRMMGRQAVGGIPNVRPLASPGPGKATRGDLGYVLVEVADTGCGMDENAIEKAFEPFLTTKARGTGLGLAIVKSIIEEHGGSVRIVSNKDEGTSVSFTLPLRQLEEKDDDASSDDGVADSG